MSNPPEPPRLMPLRPPPSLAIPPSNSVSYHFSSAYSPTTNKQQHSGHMANNTFFRPILPAPGLFDPCENRHLRGEANADTLTARDTQRSPPLLVFPTPVKPTPGKPHARQRTTRKGGQSGGNRRAEVLWCMDICVSGCVCGCV